MRQTRFVITESVFTEHGCKIPLSCIVVESSIQGDRDSLNLEDFIGVDEIAHCLHMGNLRWNDLDEGVHIFS